MKLNAITITRLFSAYSVIIDGVKDRKLNSFLLFPVSTLDEMTKISV